MSELSFLEKLALEVEQNDSGNSGFENNQSGIGIEKLAKGKKPSFDSKQSKDGDGSSENKKGDNTEKKDGKISPFGKHFEKKDGKVQEDKQDGSDKDNTIDKTNNAKGQEGSEKAGPQANDGNVQNMQGNEQQGTSTGSIDPTVIIDFLSQNPAPTDQDFHQFAESQGIDTHQAESIAYALAGRYVMLLRGGKSGGQSDTSSIDPQQLEQGIQVETEHTSDPTTAKKIALDHLTEIPDYYTRLAQMEGSGEQVVAQPKGKEENFKSKNKEEKPNFKDKEEKKDNK